MSQTHTPPQALRRLLATQVANSGIQSVDVLHYAVIAEWLCRRYGSIEDWSIPKESLDWLYAESGFREDQRVKATYIARLLIDYHAGRPSEPCPEFQIVCECGRLVSRKGTESHRYPMYRCSCGRACGFHKGDGWPLGLLGTKAVRQWRGKLHRLYDSLTLLWGVSEKRGYEHLATLLDVPIYQCHFSLVVDEGRAKEIYKIMQTEIDRLRKEKGIIRAANDQLPMPLAG